ncbi:MAG: TMAO reductase system periplasmic protein TorT [Rhodobacterales bacterium 65-51]|uniref:TMAO reductase system periplasmic protein TorT n=1 Tax=uncultured Gemmobacter sp. TaxID=1095917 RepID=UPI000962F8D5|nr:TMAO reductase system periplasmic protein TorT [uncultured Gemmobacter sp.]OJY27920.1 MAG: TMAO reductase system periplasmic protein TorT [Rhodobacterales bacterium 65-51]
MRKLPGLTLALAGWLGASLPAIAETVWKLEARSFPFDDSSPAHPVNYHPLDHATRPWRLCILYPHLKDAYWLSVNYGMVEEARRLGVAFYVFEAGGYPNLDRQAEQLKGCSGAEFDAVILGTVSYDGLTPLVEALAARKPVIAAVNDIDDRGISGKASVPWTEMGAAAGRFIAARHPRGSAPVRLAWFPGPTGAGWVSFVEQGFRSAIAGSSAEIVTTLYGDTGLEQQVLLVEEALDQRPDIDYLVGSGPMAEAAVSILRARGATDRVRVVSTYLSHAVYRGVIRGRIMAAPTDFPVEQGRLSVEMAVRALEGRLELTHAGPPILVVTAETAGPAVVEGSLAPASFVPVFSLAPPP